MKRAAVCIDEEEEDELTQVLPKLKSSIDFNTKDEIRIPATQLGSELLEAYAKSQKNKISVGKVVNEGTIYPAQKGWTLGKSDGDSTNSN